MTEEKIESACATGEQKPATPQMQPPLTERERYLVDLAQSELIDKLQRTGKV